MELLTVGERFYPDYEILLWYTPDETCSPHLGNGTRFRLILVEQGAGVVRLDHHSEAFIAPTVFCLNETDSPHLEPTIEVKAKGLYFHPSAINSIFDFQNIREVPDTFSTTERQDTFMLQAFVQRYAGYHGQLHLGPASAQRIGHLLEMLGQEITRQDNNTWPCRSRSFMLEILFITNRIFTMPEKPVLPTIEEPLPQPSADPIILYLHTHYHEKFTIEDLARLFHTNRTSLNERFRQTTGVPVMTYLARLRIQLATCMLHDTELPIFEVASRVGYSDLTHFGRTFRKYTGCTPSEYRERYCWMLH